MSVELPPDVVRGIVEHMNDDHADALLACVRAYTAHGEASAARMTGIDAHGFGVDGTDPDGAFAVVVPFEEPLSSAADVRPVLVAMTRSARATLERRRG